MRSPSAPPDADAGAATPQRAATRRRTAKPGSAATTGEPPATPERPGMTETAAGLAETAAGLAETAAALREPAERTSTTELAAATSHQLVIFSLEGEDYALPIAQIKEVIRYTKPRRIASNDHRITGVITLRGQIVPIADLSMSLGASPELSDDAKIIITETAAGIAGIVVDAVDEVLTIQSGQIDTTTAVNRDVMHGIVKLGDRLVVFLNVEALLAGIDGSSGD
jgi:purine-binding chemotaxis protein CheW